MTEFCAALFESLLIHLDNWYTDNFSHQCGKEPEKNVALFYVHRTGVLEITRQQLNAEILVKMKELVQQYENLFGFAFVKLEDAYSKNLLIKLCTYRILGYRKVKLPSHSPAFFEALEKARKLQQPTDENVAVTGFSLGYFDLNSAGFPLRLFSSADGIQVLFFYKQYAYQENGMNISIAPGDVVIDAGACWGDSSLMFAHETGEKGHIYAFEFVGKNLNAFNRNLSLNPELASRVTIVERAVQHRSNETISFQDDGPGTTLVMGREAKDQVITLSIDDLVQEKKLEKVDFIKMDIETSELAALKGAEKTLCQFKPKLAISAYHKKEDLLELPSYLQSLNLGYKFYLKQATLHLGETVLFAVV